MRIREAAVAVALAVAGCGGGDGGDPPAGPAAAPTSVVKTARAPTAPIPDVNGQLVPPVPTGSSNPDKAWGVPDAVEGLDWVSAADAEYLATVRPAVPYTTPEQSMSNSTLIAIGRKACSPAAVYQAGRTTVSGAAAEVVHGAALKSYC